MNEGWAVACTKPNCERTALANLDQQGFESFAPRCRVVRTKRETFLFPGYVMVKVGIETAWRALLGTKGISSLIMSGERPGLLRAREVEDLQGRAGRDGVIELGEQFEVGQTVQIEAGAFRGWDAIYDGASAENRCWVLLRLLGRQVRAQVGETDLAPA